MNAAEAIEAMLTERPPEYWDSGGRRLAAPPLSSCDTCGAAVPSEQITTVDSVSGEANVCPQCRGAETCPECGSEDLRVRRDPAARGQSMVTTACLACDTLISAELD